MPVEEPNAPEPAILVLRCSRCGDTFPAKIGEDVVCPSCRGEELEPASEPLL